MVINSTNHTILSLASALKQGDLSEQNVGDWVYLKEMMDNTGRGKTAAEQGRDYSPVVGDSQGNRRSQLQEKFLKE